MAEYLDPKLKGKKYSFEAWNVVLANVWVNVQVEASCIHAPASDYMEFVENLFMWSILTPGVWHIWLTSEYVYSDVKHSEIKNSEVLSKRFKWENLQVTEFRIILCRTSVNAKYFI